MVISVNGNFSDRLTVSGVKQSFFPVHSYHVTFSNGESVSLDPMEGGYAAYMGPIGAIAHVERYPITGIIRKIVKMDYSI